MADEKLRFFFQTEENRVAYAKQRNYCVKLLQQKKATILWKLKP